MYNYYHLYISVYIVKVNKDIAKTNSLFVFLNMRH